MWAASEGHRSTMHILLKAGADVNVKNDEGRTIMDFVDRWQDETLLALVEAKYEDDSVATAIMLKEKRGRIRTLLEVAQEGSPKQEEALPPYTSSEVLSIRNGKD